jgi:hypothetical protein
LQRFQDVDARHKAGHDGEAKRILFAQSCSAGEVRAIKSGFYSNGAVGDRAIFVGAKRDRR